jgi:hypothetical protein
MAGWVPPRKNHIFYVHGTMKRSKFRIFQLNGLALVEEIASTYIIMHYINRAYGNMVLVVTPNPTFSGGQC